MKKSNNILKYVIIGLIVLLLGELVYFGIRMINNRKNTVYYSNSVNSIMANNLVISVGTSDSKYSKFLNYERPGYNKPYIWVYDKKLSIKKEYKLNIGYNGIYNDIVSVSDGYVAVGNIEMTESEHKDALTEAIIVKYDKNFKLLWRKNFKVLDNNSFSAIKVDNDNNYIITGSSIYASDIIGNHTTGGAILVKYDSNGNELFRVNNGGPRTGSYNDLVIVSDGYIVVGVKNTGTGIINKYDYNGKELWHNYYGYTDKNGLTSINIDKDNNLIVTGSKLNKQTDTSNYKAAIIKFNQSGELLLDSTYQKDKISIFTDSVIINDKIIVSGLYGYIKDKKLINQSVLVTYNNDLEKNSEKTYTGNKTFSINKLMLLDNNYLITGNTNSKLNEFKTNGYDYFNIIKRIGD